MSKKKSKKIKNNNVLNPIENNLYINNLRNLELGSIFNDFFPSRAYTPKQVQEYLLEPFNNVNNLREVSLYLLENSTLYSKLINYLSTQLTLDNLLIPLDTGTKEQKKKWLEKSNKLIKKYNLKSNLLDIIKILFVEDVFFGLEIEDDNSITFCRLPSQFCTIIGEMDNLNIFILDLTFFDINIHLLEIVPFEIREQYLKFKEDNSLRYFEIDNTIGGVCFKLQKEIRYNLPFLSHMFSELIALEIRKDLFNKESLSNAINLLVQEIPLGKNAKNESDITLPEHIVEMAHNTLKKSVPPTTAVFTTPMKVTSLNLAKDNQPNQNLLNNNNDFLINSTGYGKFLDSNIKSDLALELSKLSDETILFKLLRQFEDYFNVKIRNNLRNENVKIKFLDITYSNREKNISNYLKLAQFGFPKSLVGIASGLSQEELYGLNSFENDFDFTEELKPLNSPHTKSKNDTSNNSTNEEIDEDNKLNNMEDNKKEEINTGKEIEEGEMV